MTDRTREALAEAIEIIKSWHGPVAWDIYYEHSPEMKRLRAALADPPAPPELSMSMFASKEDHDQAVKLLLGHPTEASTGQPEAVDGDRADAARYRWLRDKSEPGICTFYLSVGNGLHGVRFARATVDEAIDAQIGASEPDAKPASTEPSPRSAEAGSTEDARLLRFLCDLHSHLPEAERPMGWSDFSDEQAARARRAFANLAAPVQSGAPAAEPSPAEDPRRIAAENKMNARFQSALAEPSHPDAGILKVRRMESQIHPAWYIAKELTALNLGATLQAKVDDIVSRMLHAVAEPPNRSSDAT